MMNLEFNPEYSWIKTISPDLENVIIGEWGTGETRSEKFKGIKKAGSGHPESNRVKK